MSDALHIDNDGETPVNPYSLLEAVNRSSDTAHMAWLIFLAIMAYLTIAVAGVSHRDFLLERDVQLPILGVPIPLVQFFQFAPIFLLLFHFGLLAQLVLLARKTLEFDISVQQLEPTSRRTHPLRLELHNFFFVQGIAGAHRSIVMGLFLHSMSWMTLVVLPVVLMLFIQLSFLPYHNVAITWTQRVALIADIGVLGLIGVFLTRVETNFFQAFWRASVSYPITSIVTLLLLAAIGMFSLFVATVPGETLDKAVRRYFAERQSDPVDAQSKYPVHGFSLPNFLESPDGSLFGFFYRRLIVSDADLVADSEVAEGERSLSLRGRDLRFAELDRSDLHRADMTGANLDGASLTGANLRGVRLNCQSETELFLGEGGRKQAKCATARGANFKDADLHDALLTGVDLSGAELENAKLENASLRFAVLERANFGNANLRKADLAAGVLAHGAIFLVARLEGADFTGAQLQFADFSNAQMQGVSLTHAHLQGAVLHNADLSAASLRRTGLHGADMTGTVLLGADLRSSRVWMTLPPEAGDMKLADMSEAQIEPLNEIDRNTLERTLKSIKNSDLRAQAAHSIGGIVSPQKSAAWKDTADMKRWQALVAAAQPQNIPDYRAELTSFLEKLACQIVWRQGSVAEGVVRRATERQFLGDLPALYVRFTADDECLLTEAISSRLLQTMTVAVNRRMETIER